MNKLVSLLQATMSEGVQLFNYRAKTDRSRRIMPILLGALVGVMMFFSVNAMMVGLKEDGAESTALSLYALVTSIVIMTEGIYKSGDLLFRPRDNDMLLAMPFKKSIIVAARIIKFYTFELMYCLIFFLPAVVTYAINMPVGATYYLVAIVALLLLPIIPIAISCVAGLIITAFSSRFKHKTFLQTTLSFVALLAMVALIMFANGSSGPTMLAISNKATELYYPTAAIVRLATDFDIWQFLLFIAVNLAIGTIIVLIVSKFYDQIVMRLNTVEHVKIARTEYIFKRHGQIFAIVKKELARYFNTPVLLMNTAIGLVLFAVAVGILCFKFDDIMASLMESVENFPLTADEIRALMPSVTFALVAFVSLMTFITATMISLEGRTFNLLKSMPIGGKRVLMSKVLAAMLLIVPITTLGSIVACLRFQFGIVDMLLVAIGVIALPLVTELIGILIDLRYARFDAETDAVTVKQSASVMVATFLGLGMVLVTISLTFVAVLFAGQTAGLAMIDAMFVIIALYLYFAVATRGEERYKKLSA